jgi:hypothetical protein
MVSNFQSRLVTVASVIFGFFAAMLVNEVYVDAWSLVDPHLDLYEKLAGTTDLGKLIWLPDQIPLWLICAGMWLIARRLAPKVARQFAIGLLVYCAFAFFDLMFFDDLSSPFLTHRDR